VGRRQGGCLCDAEHVVVEYAAALHVGVAVPIVRALQPAVMAGAACCMPHVARRMLHTLCYTLHARCCPKLPPRPMQRCRAQSRCSVAAASPVPAQMWQGRAQSRS
jgi:hypothetical protein